MEKTLVVVQLQVQGVHYWASCNIDEVMFLKNHHRHVFYIRCKKAVSHDDRDIEIIQLKNRIANLLFKKYPKIPGSDHILLFGSDSCEMIARLLFKEFDLDYCRVLEDDENGAEIVL